MKKKSWSKMTKAEKRVAIAQDVITQIKLKKIDPTESKYVNVESEEDFDKINNRLDDGPVELQSILPDITCQACAKGSLFLCDILKNDKYEIDSYYPLIDSLDYSDLKPRLLKYFTNNQLDLIECAFEKRVIEYNNDYLNSDTFMNLFQPVIPTPIAKKAIAFGKRFKSVKNRLIAIMSNIIDNKGEFIP